VITLSNYPKGLLDLLGSQNFGENPRIFEDRILGVVDVGAQLQVNKTVAIATPAFLPGGTGFRVDANNLLRVPAGETWLVKAFHAGVTTAVGEAINYHPAVGMDGNSFALATSRAVGASLNDSHPSIVQGFWIPAGAQLGVFVNSLTGAPFAALGAIVVRLRA